MNETTKTIETTEVKTLDQIKADAEAKNDVKPILDETDLKHLVVWIRRQVKELGVTQIKFCEMLGFNSTWLGQLGTLGGGRTHRVVPSYGEIKKLAHEFNIPALYIFVAFGYPGYSMETHVKDDKVKEKIEKIKEDARKLYVEQELAKSFKKMKDLKPASRAKVVAERRKAKNDKDLDICDEIDRIITDKLTTNVKPMVWNERGMLKIVFCRDGAEDYIFEYLIDPEKIAAEAMEGFRKFIMSEFFKEETE